MLRQILFSASQCGKGWHHIGEVNDILQFLDGHLLGLVDDQWHTYASLIELSFAAMESGSTVQFLQGSLHGRSVVGGKDDEGILPQSQPFQFVHQSSDGSIHVGDERGIALGVHAPVLPLVIPGSVLDDIRFMGSIVGKIEEEGIVLVAAHKGDGIIS